MSIEIGKRLGRYEIRSLIGVGGMGEVYRANDPKIVACDSDKLPLALESVSKTTSPGLSPRSGRKHKAQGVSPGKGSFHRSSPRMRAADQNKHGLSLSTTA